MAGELDSKARDAGKSKSVVLVRRANGTVGAVKVSYESGRERHELEIKRAHANIGNGKAGKMPRLMSHRNNHRIVYDFGLYGNVIKGSGAYYTSKDDEGIEMTPSIKSLIARSEVVSEMLSHAAGVASSDALKLNKAAMNEVTGIVLGAAKSEATFASELGKILSLELPKGAGPLRSTLERSRISFESVRKRL